MNRLIAPEKLSYHEGNKTTLMVVVDDLKKESEKELNIKGCTLYTYFILQLVLNR